MDHMPELNGTDYQAYEVYGKQNANGYINYCTVLFIADNDDEANAMSGNAILNQNSSTIECAMNTMLSDQNFRTPIAIFRSDKLH